MNAVITSFASAVLLVTLGACSSTPGGADHKAAEPGHTVDFSGSWEMDYGRSDKLDDRLRSIFKELQRQAERQTRTSGSDRSSRNTTGSSSDGLSSLLAGIIPLARLADYITTSQILEIEQSDTDIRVEREDTFTLNCNFTSETAEAVKDNSGGELCGWDEHQLVFVIALTDGTHINHRLTLAPDGQQLHIATTVSRSSRSAFTLNRVYYRFDPLAPDYQCEFTLSRGNVCTRSG